MMAFMSNDIILHLHVAYIACLTASQDFGRLSAEYLFLNSHARDLRSALAVVLEELVEPLNGLQESSLFGELDVGLAHVGADGEAVLDAGVQDHLVGEGAHFLEQLLGLVALLFGEDLVGLCLGEVVVSFVFLIISWCQGMMQTYQQQR